MIVKISEKMERELISDIYESISPSAEKVLIIKDYLDKNFMRQELDDIDSNGYPIKSKTVNMLSADKQPIKTIEMSELLLILDDRFHKVIKDDNDRRSFLKQIIKDWYYKKIGNNGMLSVNLIR